MVTEVIAVFIGTNNKNLNYEIGKPYKIKITCLPSGRIKVEDTSKNTGTCQYGNIVKFLNDWNNINH